MNSHGCRAQLRNDLQLPLRNGVAPSYLLLPKEIWPNLLTFLAYRFPFLPVDGWRNRLNSGLVFDDNGQPLNEFSEYQPDGYIYYYREVSSDQEIKIPWQEEILHVDDSLIVIDKPHFLPVIPSGRFLQETLLTRLRNRADLSHLKIESFSPVHRLDMDTAGVILFTHRKEVRGAYQSMFMANGYEKEYEAIAPSVDGIKFPLTYHSYIKRDDAFYLSKNIPVESFSIHDPVIIKPNAQTEIELISKGQQYSHYRLRPSTGKKHQLRVHMAALGIPILHDGLYPIAKPMSDDLPFAEPLQLLAKRIRFKDPISGDEREFVSRQRLAWQHKI